MDEMGVQVRDGEAETETMARDHWIFQDSFEFSQTVPTLGAGA